VAGSSEELLAQEEELQFSSFTNDDAWALGCALVEAAAGLSVMDGSAVSANLGVNPSLTITAQAERACAYWPRRGEPDPRPALGEPYRRVRPVPPRAPAVPAGAPAALRQAAID